MHKQASQPASVVCVPATSGTSSPREGVREGARGGLRRGTSSPPPKPTRTRPRCRLRIRRRRPHRRRQPHPTAPRRRRPHRRYSVTSPSPPAPPCRRRRRPTLFHIANRPSQTHLRIPFVRFRDLAVHPGDIGSEDIDTITDTFSGASWHPSPPPRSLVPPDLVVAPQSTSLRPTLCLCHPTRAPDARHRHPGPSRRRHGARRFQKCLHARKNGGGGEGREEGKGKERGRGKKGRRRGRKKEKSPRASPL